MQPPVKRPPGYLPGLDGLRAVAILGVIQVHDLPWSVAGHSNAAWKSFGGWGVELFFAISGILITWRLLEDEQRLGHLSLRNFYVRRLFRIQPAALTYLGAIAVLFALAILPANWTLWWSGVFSFTNFLVTANTAPGAAAFIGHFWTLSVEEHFYLLISLLFLVARRRRTVLLALSLAILLSAQHIVRKYGGYHGATSDRRTYWVIQFLLFPALLSLVVRRRPVRSYVEQHLRPWMVVPVVLAGMWVDLFWASIPQARSEIHHFRPFDFLDGTSDAVFFGFSILVVVVMLQPRSWTTQFLELAPLRFVGRISYSLYLWHILFFVPVYLPEHIHSPLLLASAQRPWKYLLTFAFAVSSYYLIEKPMIRLGHRLAPPATPGHRGLGSIADQPAASSATATPHPVNAR